MRKMKEFLKEVGDDGHVELKECETEVLSDSQCRLYQKVSSTSIDFRDEYHYFTLYAPSYRLRPIPYADR